MTELYAEFFGGPNDGQVLAIELGPDDLPLDHIKVAVFNSPTANFATEADIRPDAEVPYDVVIYRRDAISDETHRWQYRIT